MQTAGEINKDNQNVFVEMVLLAMVIYVTLCQLHENQTHASNLVCVDVELFVVIEMVKLLVIVETAELIINKFAATENIDATAGVIHTVVLSMVLHMISWVDALTILSQLNAMEENCQMI